MPAPSRRFNLGFRHCAASGSPPWTPRSAGMVLPFLLGEDPFSCLPEAGRKSHHLLAPCLFFFRLPLCLPVCLSACPFVLARLLPKMREAIKTKTMSLRVVPDHWGAVSSQRLYFAIDENRSLTERSTSCQRRHSLQAAPTMARMSQESGQTPLGDLCGSITRAQETAGASCVSQDRGSMSSRRSNLAGSRDRPPMKSLMALLACFVSTSQPITALVGRPSNVDRPSSCYTSQRPCTWSQSAATPRQQVGSRSLWGRTGSLVHDHRRCHHLPQISTSPSPSRLPRFSSIQPHHRRTAAGSLV